MPISYFASRVLKKVFQQAIVRCMAPGSPSEDKYPKEKKLVTISEYAERTGIERTKVYRLMESGKLTRYLGVDNEPMLDPEEKPSDEEDEHKGDT